MHSNDYIYKKKVINKVSRIHTDLCYIYDKKAKIETERLSRIEFTDPPK